MKKSFLTVLVLLVLMVSFFAIGCEKDKSSEVVQQYEEKIKDFEDYQKSAKITDSLETFIGSVIDANFGKRECLFRKMGMPFRNKGNVDSLEVVRS